MDTYTYLLITLLLLMPWLLIYGLKASVRKKMIKASIMGGLSGLIAEYWYFKDYWQPPTILGQSVISVEDFLFGFTITGIAVSIYEVAFAKNYQATHKNRRRQFGYMFLCGVLCMMVFNVMLGINSIIVSCIAFLVFTAVMLCFRSDLLKQSLLSGILTLCIIVPVYTFLFDFLNPGYWAAHWLLAKTQLGITVLGNIPVTELVWYFSWGCFAGTAHSFASGKAVIQLRVVKGYQMPDFKVLNTTIIIKDNV